MALISDVKCSKCERRYSGLRSRCPYCGYRRTKAGKYAASQSNSKGKLVLGLLLILVVFVAVVVLVVTGDGAGNQAANDAAKAKTNPADEDVTGVSGSSKKDNQAANSSQPANTQETEEGQVTSNKIQEVLIKWGNTVEYDFTIPVGTSLLLNCEVKPEVDNPTVEWVSDNEDVFTVTENGEITAVGKGTANLTCTVDGTSATCIVRVSGS